MTQKNNNKKTGVPSKQGSVTPKKDYEVGRGKPPKNRQFGQPNGNPRSNGSWKKEDTPRYKLEQMMKLSEKELVEIYINKEAPLFERKLAQAINNGSWGEIKEMIQEVYGKPSATIVQRVEVSDPYEGLTTEELKKLIDNQGE